MHIFPPCFITILNYVRLTLKYDFSVLYTFSNGPALEEPLKVPEPSPVHIQAPPVSQKQEVEIVPVVEREQTRVEEVLVPEEKFEHKSYEPKAESKPAVTEPVQQEFNEPQPGIPFFYYYTSFLCVCVLYAHIISMVYFFFNFCFAKFVLLNAPFQGQSQ